MSRVFAATSSPLPARTLVEASAGTGKTFAITTLVVRLLLEQQLDIDQILVVTFTEAATAELRDRVRARLRAAVVALQRGFDRDDPDLDALVKARVDRAGDLRRMAVALRNIDEAAIFTIHGFCRRVLHDNAFDSDALFEQELVTDLDGLRDDVVADWWVKELADGSAERITWLKLAHIGFAAAGALVDRAVANRELELVPAAQPPREGWHADFAAAVARASALWNEADVLALLESAPLKRGTYRPDQLAGWCRQMTAYLADPVPGEFGKPYDRFCAAKIQDSIRKNGTPPQHAFFEACDRLAALCAEFVAAGRAYGIAFCHGLVAYARSEMPRRKEALGVLSFDDLLQRLQDALAVRGSSGTLATAIRRRWPVALVDEFQDTDPLQWRIFDTIYPADRARLLLLVGDPKQAIYSFRGADVFAYLAAREAVPAGGAYTLGRNWRSDPGLVRAVQELFARSPRPFFLPGIDCPPVQARPGAADSFVAPAPFGCAPLEILFVRRTPDEMRNNRSFRRVDSGWRHRGLPAVIAAEIAQLLRCGATANGKPIEAGRIAVLTRTNAQAFEMQKAQRALAVPSVVIGDRSVFEQDEAGELACVLRAVAEPTDHRALRTALTTVLLGVDAAGLVAMDEKPSEWDGWVVRFRRWSAAWSERGFVQMMRMLLADAGVQQQLLALRGGERRMTNLLHLIELLHEASTTQHLGPTALLHWLAVQRQTSGYAQEERQVRLESDDRAVKLTTVHKAKGLEYDVVYCPSLGSEWLLGKDEKHSPALLFHDPEDGRRKLHVDGDRESGDLVLAAVERERLSENLRLLYVALTRAKHRCTVVWGAFKDFENAALGTLLYPMAQPAEFVGEVRGHLESLDDDRMLAGLRALAAGSEGRISVRELDRDTVGVPLAPDAAPDVALVCRQPSHAVDFAWRVASFSGLASSAPARGIDTDEARERDELTGEEQPIAVAAAAGPSVPLQAFPRGARAGVFFHEVLEHLDFAAEAEARRELVVAMLRRHGFDESWLEVVDGAVAAVLATPLTEDGMRLVDVARDRRLDELEFHLPVACGRDAASRERVTPSRLAGVFRDHPSPELPADYAERVRRLEFKQLEGFLKGYVDCVFEHQGRYWLVDYKTSHLGNERGRYGRARLALPMSHGHYFLQYHLYALAVDRYLRQRVVGYRYERDFGGVLYLFLRGMDPTAGPACGVFFEKPPAERLRALGAVLDG